MTTWTPNTPYEPGDIVTAPALVDAGLTIPERLTLAAATLLAAAGAVFALLHIWQFNEIMLEVWPLKPNLRLQAWWFTPNEIRPQLAMLSAALLFLSGVLLIVDWRRKRREPRPWTLNRPDPLFYDKYAVQGGYTAPAGGKRPPLPTTGSAVKQPALEAYERGMDSLSSAIKSAFSGVSIDFVDEDPHTELQRHLTDALAVLLREPSLTIDAGTLRMLAKHKAKAAKVRDDKGRWRRVQ
jgi:hypothetical protein